MTTKRASGTATKKAPRKPAAVKVSAAPREPAEVTSLASLTQPAVALLRPQLALLGYETAEEVVGVLHAAGRELTRYLGVAAPTVEAFTSAVQAVASPVTAQEQLVIESAPYSLGVVLDQIPVQNIPFDLPPLAALGSAAEGPPLTGGAGEPPVAAPAAMVNHIPNMPPVHDQDQRGTCVAFAALAAYEHFLGLNGTGVDLAEQFLYWDCKAHDHYPGSGTWLRVAYQMLEQDGCCPEDTWPYDPNPVPGNEGQGLPPPNAVFEALTYRLAHYLTLAPNSVADIKATLLANRCVSFSVPVYNSLMRNAQALKTGTIPNPVPGEIPVGGHAMCFVGYEDNPSVPGLGGGRFLVRNSWGARFGFASAYATGYGTISFAYIARLGREAFAPG